MKSEQQIILAATNAIHFYRAAKRCDDPRLLPIGIPAIVCGTFSIELSLKSMLYDLGINPKGHSLVKLFNMLPENLKHEIEVSVSRVWPDYQEQFKNCDMAFVNWRYAHESKEELNINSKFVIMFAENCCRIVMRELGINSNVELADIE